MSLPVHWVPTLVDVRPGDTVEVTGDEAHHAVAVRRLRAGERLVLTDGAGLRVTGEVTATGKRSLAVRVEDRQSVARTGPWFTVVQALPKGERGELAVEVLTEVGADRIVPWAAARSVAVWRGERATKSHAKWVATAREAAKQARRTWFPEVDPLASTPEVAALLAEADLAVVLHEDAAATVAALELPVEGRVVVVVGPEGGIAPEELETFAGVVPVRLGSEVLRTSTAGVVALGALMSRTSRWGAGTTTAG
ncbi:16S rRNA (uracil(1498)-N(3))-methyltransferase [Nocardioides houyundeii]|uniref:16S rRNA (uracil(1498)-N(3))-methyltransferase n=1 Tax=Nocardioides houyundeii TaxID=2045452 RepID=UPI000C7723F9|nr:16S rRNA (uracil(1498)-N(3))-methyltransferase [Nocardioides houyundeii]